MTMVLLVQILLLTYMMGLIFIIIGWKRSVVGNNSLPSKEGLPYLSVIVPARNETKNIVNLLDSLSVQDYPIDRFEVLLVDDHSGDSTADVFRTWNKEHNIQSFQLISLSENLSGKKAAIAEGIRKAKGEIIVTTDADCTLHPVWLKSVAAAFHENIQMICGPVKLKSDSSLFTSFQTFDFAALIGVGASMINFGLPTMCNGANLAYRKEAFIKVNGFEGNEHIASGDDEFLMRKITLHFPNSVKFNVSREAIVETAACNSLNEFINQRVRWAGKWKSHGLGTSSLLAFFIFLVNLSVMLLVPLIIFKSMTPELAALLLIGKMVIEAMFLHRILKFQEIPFNTIHFVVVQLIYPFYVIFFGIAANFFQVTWKHRRI